MMLNDLILAIGGVFIAIGIISSIVTSVQATRQHNRWDNLNSDGTPKRVRKSKVPIGFLIAGILLIFVSSTFQIIPTGYTGVRTTFGLIDQESCPPGLNFTIPIAQKISLVNNKQQDIRFDGQIWSETNEQTAVYMEGVAVTYRIIPESSAWIYANVENWVQELIDYDITSSALKATSRKLSANNVTDRSVIEPAAKKNLQKSIDDKYGTNRVEIKNVIINNMDFDESYNDAIAKKSEELKKQQTQEIINQTNIGIATAEAEAARERAQGKADAAIIEANGKAEANQIIAASITASTQRQDVIDKWDGTLPRYSGSDVGFNILDIPEYAPQTPAAPADTDE